ncbi:MAG: hypothetical protein ABIH70_09725 [Chloroflexota bacterium]
MLKIASKTKLKPEQVIKKAVEFFGPSGNKLKVTEQSEACVSFEGMGGMVRVDVCPQGKLTEVVMETREFEYQAKEFLQKIK